MAPHPFTDHLSLRGHVLLDGGLATQLEVHGHDLNDPLWSARLLVEDPESIVRAHTAFLEAGADCIVTSSYQATIEGFEQRGFGRDESRRLLLSSHELGVRARDAYVETHDPAGPIPQVAASIGPYGAFLADGSEYRGDYDLDVAGLVDFHRERFELLAGAADLLAIETIPSLDEASALRALLVENGRTPAWVSFSCRDGEHLCDGTPLAEAAALFVDLPQVFAAGLNCTAPQHVRGLVDRLRASGWPREIVAYPNSGEAYDASSKAWVEGSATCSIAASVASWRDAGARVIGGCCRVTADELRGLRSALRPA